ncbi:MAG: DUF6796 family protein [Bacteroidota bacterium]
MILFGYALALFPGYHYSTVLYSLGFQAADGSSNNLLNDQLMQVHAGTLMIIMPLVILSSLWIATLILSGKTRYARWMVVASPLLIVLIPTLVVEMIPSPWAAILFLDRELLG